MTVDPVDPSIQSWTFVVENILFKPFFRKSLVIVFAFEKNKLFHDLTKIFWSDLFQNEKSFFEKEFRDFQIIFCFDRFSDSTSKLFFIIFTKNAYSKSQNKAELKSSISTIFSWLIMRKRVLTLPTEFLWASHFDYEQFWMSARILALKDYSSDS